MKRPTGKPSDEPMRFFTRELYRQFNSSDEAEADRADTAWEAAIKGCRENLGTIRERLPSGALQLSELCLHDAEILALSVGAEPAARSGPAIVVLSVSSGSQVTDLVYLGAEHVRQLPADPNWPFSAERKHWLYDEIDLARAPAGGFVHRILFSDGSVAEIPFTSVVIHRYDVPGLASSTARRTA